MRMSLRARPVSILAALVVLMTLSPAIDRAEALPSGFQETTVWSGLTEPTAVEFAADGSIFVAEKSGIVKKFDALTDTTATVVADLRTNVHNYWDRGLLDIAIDPNYPTSPYIYALYTFDAAIGGTPPRWGTTGGTSDDCPNPPGATADGCVVGGRLSRLDLGAGAQEKVLVEDWCQQYPSHSLGTVEFGPDGSLYAGAGDGASFNFTDYGQDGNPTNPCGDPPTGPGTALTPPTAEGGALRSQDLRTTADPLGLSGSIIRVDPATGAGLPGNPMFGNTNANARRIVATGFRNPYRFTVRPGTNELWVGDVGYSRTEEIDVVPNPIDSTVDNFGWPCYEGAGRQPAYDGANLSICETLYTQAGAVSSPFFAYDHTQQVVTNDGCPTGSSSITGTAFYQGGNYPDNYDGALFFSDYSRDCIWVMFQTNGLLDPSARQVFIPSAANPVQLKIGPAGDLFYVDFNGSIRRIRFIDQNPPPPAESTYLSDLPRVTSTNGWGPVEIDKSNGEAAGGDGGPIRLNGTTYLKGLGVHAVSNVSYDLAGECSRLTAKIGVDDEVGNSGSVVFEVFGDATQLYTSGTMTGASATKTIDVDISGVDRLSLRVGDGGNGATRDHADWADALVLCGGEPPPPPPPPPPPEGTLFLSDLTPTSEINGFGPLERDMSNGEQAGGDGRTITIGGATFTKGLGAHSYSEVHFDLAQGCTTFSSKVGVDDEVSSGSVTFEVWADGTRLYNSGVVTGAMAAIPVDVSVANANELVLIVTDGGNGAAYDHADWADAKVACGTATSTPPVPTIDSPAETFTWRVGDQIAFSGSATDAEDGTLPASALAWTVVLHHCPSNCHEHNIQSFNGVASGSLPAPDHEWPSFIELRMTATDSDGVAATTSLDLDPRTVGLSFESNPSGAEIGVGGVNENAPFDRIVIVGSKNSIAAISPQTIAGKQYTFGSWSDEGAIQHDVVAPATPTTYTATFVDGTAPVISNVRVTRLERRSATIAWTTNEPATTQIEFGTTAALGSTTTLETSRVRQHSQRIRGLQPNTLYHFRVRSRDADGNVATSTIGTFTTTG